MILVNLDNSRTLYSLSLYPPLFHPRTNYFPSISLQAVHMTVGIIASFFLDRNY
jgi:hypothetical protein